MRIIDKPNNICTVGWSSWLVRGTADQANIVEDHLRFAGLPKLTPCFCVRHYGTFNNPDIKDGKWCYGWLYYNPKPCEKVFYINFPSDRESEIIDILKKGR